MTGLDRFSIIIIEVIIFVFPSKKYSPQSTVKCVQKQVNTLLFKREKCLKIVTFAHY